jgi:hypothetical protein
MAITVKVYGRLRAKRTIHMAVVSALFAGQGFLWQHRCRGSGVDVFAKRLPRVLQPRGHDPCTQLQ